MILQTRESDGTDKKSYRSLIIFSLYEWSGASGTEGEILMNFTFIIIIIIIVLELLADYVRGCKMFLIDIVF